MRYTLARFDDEIAATAGLGSLASDASQTLVVTAYAQLPVYGGPDEAGEVAELSPAVIADGYWLLYADEAGSEPLILPQGIEAISPVFAGMENPAKR